MKILLSIIVLAVAVLAVVGQEQQRILRRVIKSTPTATHLARVKLVTVRSASAEPGAVAQISSKEAASFGQRSSSEQLVNQSGGIKAKAPSTTSTPASTTTTTTTTTSSPSTTTTTSQPSTTVAASTTSKPQIKASDRQQAAPQQGEVEVLAGSPSSWQTMTAVEAPAAALIAMGTRAAQSSDLASSSSEDDFLRSSRQSSASETFSRLRQQSTKQQQQQQTYFYPQQQQQSQQVKGKTSSYQATKTHWYQPTTTTQRPAPLVQERYEQQNEQYVEQQQQQVEYGAAPLGQAEPFAFDFKTQDQSGNGQYRKEESDKNGVVRGSYGYTDANGIYRHVEYVADQNGFRANIKSNEPGLIGETQPASIKMDGGPAPARFSAPSASSNDNGEWSPSASTSNEGPSSADLAVAPPDFESSHKSERIRAARHFRN